MVGVSGLGNEAPSLSTKKPKGSGFLHRQSQLGVGGRRQPKRTVKDRDTENHRGREEMGGRQRQKTEEATQEIGTAGERNGHRSPPTDQTPGKTEGEGRSQDTTPHATPTPGRGRAPGTKVIKMAQFKVHTCSGRAAGEGAAEARLGPALLPAGLCCPLLAPVCEAQVERKNETQQGFLA